MQRLTQAGTRRAALLASALLGFACGGSDAPSTWPDAEDGADGGDGTPDGGDGTPDGGDGTPDGDGSCQAGCDGSDAPGEPTSCDEARAREQAFRAAHAQCAVDADCVAIGSCDNADFLTVSAASSDEAAALVEARPETCRSQDGPVPYAVCHAGTCEPVFSAHVCGEVFVATCPTGQDSLRIDCDGGDSAPLCATRCDPEAPSPCAPGFTCQASTVAPCTDAVDPSDACTACAPGAYVCRPDPACTLSLALALDGREVVALSRDQATELTVAVTNRTDVPLTFTYDAPCHGPAVTGLGTYDLWEGCLAGACPDESAPRSVTLAARETRLLARSLVRPAASTCNAEGLAEGTYTLGLTLSQLTGAVVCGAVPVELRVLSDGP